LPDVPERTEHAAISLIVLLVFLITIALNWLPVSIAALLAGVIVILTGCETVEQARSSIQWQVLFLIGGMLPMATALEKTGAASFMISLLYQVVGGLGPRGLLLTFFAITAGLAQFTSGQAATLIVGPIALTSALQYGINPLSLMMGVAIGASTGFLSPVSHPANLLVMGPGGYHFADYAKLGAVLVILTAAGVMLLTPLAYPF
jgi:di/tricarboxylate transporter